MKPGGLRILFILTLFSVFNSLSAETIKIGLFRNTSVSQFMITASKGQYDIYGDSVKIHSLVQEDPLKILADTGWVTLVSMQGVIGTYKNLYFVCHDSLSNIKVKGQSPVTKEKQVNGNLSFTSDGKLIKLINIVNLEEYISGVVESEAGHGHNPEFYKVQCIISRTYALSNKRKHEAEGFHLCDQVHCQAYKGMCKNNLVIHQAAIDTRGSVVVDDSLKLITAAFHSNCGGQTANSEQVWSKPLPYLRSIKDSYCQTQPNAYWKKENRKRINSEAS